MGLDLEKALPIPCMGSTKCLCVFWIQLDQNQTVLLEPDFGTSKLQACKTSQAADRSLNQLQPLYFRIIRC